MLLISINCTRGAYVADTQVLSFEDIQSLLAHTIQCQASDLHLSTGMPAMLRIAGDMAAVNMPALQETEVEAFINSTMSNAQYNEFQNNLELDYAYFLPGVGRFRINAFTQSRGAAAVFRIIPSKVPSLAQLNLNQSADTSLASSTAHSKIPKPDTQATFEKIANLRQGLVLVTGPTGCGKSTTVAALVDHINSTKPAHILTIEDPIEFIHDSKRSLVNQRQVSQHTSNFSSALRSALREDPDVIVIGELRDLNSIQLALTAAETGHLVFATLHTNSATKTIDRLIDVFPAAEKEMVRAMLSESLQAVISQILVKRIQGGRIAAHEIMITTPAIRNLIRQNKLAQMYSVIQTSNGIGMRTFQQSLQQLVEDKVIATEHLDT